MSYVPIVIPLAGGLTNQNSDLDGTKVGRRNAQNVDFTKAGEVVGRPGLTEKSQKMEIRRYNNTTGSILTEQTLAQTLSGGASFKTFFMQSMFRYKDSRGERPGLHALGRVWTYEDDHWADRLYAAATTVERMVEFKQFFTGSVPGANVAASQQHTVAYNYYQGTFSAATPIAGALLGGTTSSVDAYVPGTNKVLYGDNCVARNSSTGDRYHCQVGLASGEDVLRLVVRKNSDLTLSTFVINFAANDAFTFTGASPINPRCCSDETVTGGVAHIWVAYRLKGLNDLKLLRVNVLTGAIVASSTLAVASVPLGFWLSVDFTANRLLLALTRTGIAGCLARTFDVSTLGNFAGESATLDSGSGLVSTGQCVIGGHVPGGAGTGGAGTRIAYQENSSGIGTATNVVIGIYFPDIAFTVYQKTYYGTSTVAGPNQRWDIVHQPLLVGPQDPRGRVILGLMWSPFDQTVVNNTITKNPGGTWYGVDLKDLIAVTDDKIGGTKNPGIFAKGPTRGSAIPFSPVTAQHDAPTVDVFSTATGTIYGYRFPTLNFTSFSGNFGVNASLGINQVRIIQPKAATIGEQTVLSGSVPHAIARGYSFEVGFVMGAPEVSLAPNGAGGALLAGDYAIQCVWAWTDEAGVVHRSGPSISKTVTVAGGNSIDVTCQNPQLTEREYGAMRIEVYSTAVNPTATSPKVLFGTAAPTANSGTTLINVGGFAMDITGEPLYSNSGVFVNSHVSAAGGVATVNRRMWMSDGKVVYASKIFRTNNRAAAWNDEGVLQVTPPAPAGKVIALESMDDKLVILCEKGILFTYGDGPDDAGTGPDFLFPVQVSQMGVSSSLGSCATAAGIAFHSNNTNASSSTAIGGIHLLKGGGVVPVGLPAMNQWINGSAQLVYSPERDRLLVNNYTTRASTGPYLVMLDMRSDNWAIWTNPNGDDIDKPGYCFGLTEAAGLLWAGFIAGPTNSGPVIGVYDRLDGKDANPGFTDENIKMQILTNAIFADGHDGLGWARIRGVQVLGDYNLAPTHTMTLGVQLDLNRPQTSQSFNFTGATPTTWPSGRIAPEYRLPNQRASQIYVEITAVPAVAKWSALRLNVLPFRIAAPTGNRQ